MNVRTKSPTRICKTSICSSRAVYKRVSEEVLAPSDMRTPAPTNAPATGGDFVAAGNRGVPASMTAGMSIDDVRTSAEFVSDIAQHFNSPFLMRVGPTVFAARVASAVDPGSTHTASARGASAGDTYIVADVAESVTGPPVTRLELLPWHTLSFVRGSHPRLAQILAQAAVVPPVHQYTLVQTDRGQHADTQLPMRRREISLYAVNGNISYYKIAGEKHYVLAVVDDETAGGERRAPESLRTVEDALLLWRTRVVAYDNE